MDSLPIIEFDFGSTEPGESQSVELKRVAGCLATSPHETTSVVVIGYTDVIGSSPSNLTLGLERAQAVMRQLIDGGVAPGRLVIASAGELQRPRARLGLRADRVEILLARGGPSRPNEAPIVRGIDAEGLMPRARQPSASATPASPPPTPKPTRPRAPPTVTPPPRTGGR